MSSRRGCVEETKEAHQSNGLSLGRTHKSLVKLSVTPTRESTRKSSIISHCKSGYHTNFLILLKEYRNHFKWTRKQQTSSSRAAYIQLFLYKGPPLVGKPILHRLPRVVLCKRDQKVNKLGWNETFLMRLFSTPPPSSQSVYWVMMKGRYLLHVFVSVV